MGRTSSRRGKKRSAGASSTSSLAPADVAASYYVGYVEDLETPEMIMKKFEMLAEMERQHAAAAVAAVATAATAVATAAAANTNSDETGSTDSRQTETDGKSESQNTNNNNNTTQSPLSTSVSTPPGGADDSSSKEGVDAEQTNNTSGDDDTKTSNPSDQSVALSEEHFAKLFKATSTFTVAGVMNEGQALERATQAGENLYDEEFGYDYGHFVDEDGWGVGGMRTNRDHDTGEETYLFGDGTDDDDLWEECFGKANNTNGKRKSRKRKEGSSSGGDGGRASRNSNTGSSSNSKGVTQIAFVSDMRGQYVTALKRVRIVDPNAITYQRIPLVLPESWAKRIQTYVPKSMRLNTHAHWSHKDVLAQEGTQKPVPVQELKNAEYIASADVLNQDLVSLAVSRGGFQGIYMDPPWREPVLPPSTPATHTNEENRMTYTHDGLMSPEDLLSLGLGDKRVSDAGFIYVWTPKHLLGRVLGVLETMDWHYVENAISVRQSVDNNVAGEDSRFFRTCKDTLLICRRGKKSERTGKITWAPIEIRHQRISDVHFDFVKPQPEPHTKTPTNNTPSEHPTEMQTDTSTESSTEASTTTPTEPPTETESQGDHRGKTLFHQTRTTQQRGLRPFSYVHNMMETMLPQGRYNGADDVTAEQMGVEKLQAQEAKAKGAKYSTSHGQLLSLWTPPEVRRTGWVCVAQVTSLGASCSTTMS